MHKEYSIENNPCPLMICQQKDPDDFLFVLKPVKHNDNDNNSTSPATFQVPSNVNIIPIRFIFVI